MRLRIRSEQNLKNQHNPSKTSHLKFKKAKEVSKFGDMDFSAMKMCSGLELAVESCP